MLDTTASGNAIREAWIVVRASDFHPTEQHIRFSDDRILDFQELAFDVTDEQLILETHVDLADYERPAMAFYPGTELAGDPTNWWGPNPLAVEGMLKTVGFRQVKTLNVWRPEAGSTHWAPDDLAAAKQQGRAIFHAWR